MNRDEALAAARASAQRAREAAAADRSAAYARRQERIEVFEEQVARFIAREGAAGNPHLGTMQASGLVDEEVRVGVFRKEIRTREVDIEEPAWLMPAAARDGSEDLDDDVSVLSERLYLLLDGRFCRVVGRDFTIVGAGDLYDRIDEIRQYFRSVDSI